MAVLTKQQRISFVMNSWVPLVLQLTVGLLIAVVTAWTTASLSLRRFRSERTWEKKVDAYTQLLEAIFDAREHERSVIRQLTEDSRPSASAQSTSQEAATRAWRELEKQTTIGAFLVSERTAGLLRRMKQERENGDRSGGRDLFLSLEASIAAYDKYLPLLRSAAKDDLRVEN